MSNQISTQNQVLLSNLSSIPLTIENIAGQLRVSPHDLQRLFLQYPNLLKFTDSSATSAFKFNASSTQLIATWPTYVISIYPNYSINFKIYIDPPHNGLGTYVSSWIYNLCISIGSYGGGVTMTMINGVGSDAPIAYLPSFIVNYYFSVVSLEAHFELGVTYGDDSATSLSNMHVTMSAPSPIDGAPYPILNTTTQQAMTSSPTTTFTLDTNNGSNWYSFATSAGGTTNGFV